MVGKFITIEGIDGVGKTTNIKFIAELLTSNNHDVVVTREPGGTELGEILRDLLKADRQMASMTELLLMFASRAQHVAEVIQPALTAGKYVLCDRFTDATIAYQGGGRGIDLKKIKTLEQLVLGNLQPDLTILLDAPITIGAERSKQRSVADRFEQENADFFNKVRQAYLQLAANEPNRFKIINASKELNAVQAAIKQVVFSE